MRRKGPRNSEQWEEALSRPIDYENFVYLSNGIYNGDARILKKISDYVTDNFNEQAKKLMTEGDQVFKLTQFVAAIKRILFYRSIKNLPVEAIDNSIFEASEQLTRRFIEAYPDNADFLALIMTMKRYIKTTNE